MTQTCFTVLDDTRGHPDLTEQIYGILHRVAPMVKETTRPAAAEAPAVDLDCSGRMDRITAIVLCLLFDLTQQAARFNSGVNPWGQLAVYDDIDFALFTA
ncbi:hypothetical protein OG762_07870 [Streptomyces sp. NBC_01136]|uniref:hypothetical protein n=1 Tax=unclassified Streptomyces TaxID=2593676 RepID=UPI00324CF5DB|nr:hypothetical protein OG762_07870 [Streptomyces sp. NBC_01136]